MTTKAATVATPAPDDFAGLTLSGCCAACNIDRCVISGTNYCAHPAKSPLHPRQQHDPAAIERWGRAKVAIEHMRLDATQARGATK